MNTNVLRKSLVVGIILLFVGTCIIPAIALDTEKPLPSSRGYWLYVGGSGPGNYSKIQDAIDNASDGDTVFVFKDSSPYTESLTINTRIALVGEDEATTIINSPGYQGNVITIRADNISVHDFTLTYKDAMAITVLADNATLTNLLLNGSGGYGTGIIFQNAHNTFISQTIIEKTQFGISTSYDDSTSHTTIEHCLIQYCISHAIYMESSDNIIQDNTIIHNRLGIIIDDGSRNQILNNTIIAYSLNGIVINGVNNIIIGNNLINSSFQLDELRGNVFINNTVNGKPFVFLVDEAYQTIDNAGQVILVNCTHMTVKDLEIGFCRYGILLDGVTYSLVQNCTVFNCYEGIILSSGSDNLIQNSTITDCSYGIYLQGSYNTVDNNRLSKSGIVIASNGNSVYHNKLNNSSITLAGNSNTVEQNTMSSISLSNANHNTIFQNNFMKKIKPAFIYNAIRNNWTQNYWGRPMNHPKIILGSLLIFELDFDYGFTYDIKIPWINIDRYPAQEPYDIPEMS